MDFILMCVLTFKLLVFLKNIFHVVELVLPCKHPMHCLKTVSKSYKNS